METEPGTQTQNDTFSFDRGFSDLAASLLATPEVSGRAVLLVDAVCNAVPSSACVLYRLREIDGEPYWTVLALSREISFADPRIPASTGLLAPLTESPQPLVYSAADLNREDYAHLHVARTVRSIGYFPILSNEALDGVAEVVTFAQELDHDDLRVIERLTEFAAIALSTSETYETQRQDLLDSVHRLAQLYDLEKSLNATLELEPLMELVPVKVAAILPCQAVHLWMFESDMLRLVSRHGEDSTSEIGMTETASEGYVGAMAEEGEPLLISDPEDPRLVSRNMRAQNTAKVSPGISNALVVPLIHEGSEIGVLEALNKSPGAAFDDDDLFLLTTVAETVSNALNNAALMFAARKLEILEALVRVSSEITSTLRLDRLLQIIVNSPQSVLPFERCSIALDQNGKLQLKAISGMSSIPTGDIQVEQLRALLQGLSTCDRQLHARHHAEQLEHVDSKIRAAVAKHCEATGYCGLFALPLTDDQGRVGLLLYESSDPEFLETAHIEMIKVLAGQTTVAIRNALLYREVPLIGLLEPLVQRKRAFLRSDRKRRWTILGTAAAIILFLIFCPAPMRVSGPAVVAPDHIVTLTAPLDGTISSVYAREGQHVVSGEVLGAMNDWSWKTQYAAAQEKYAAALLTMQGDLARSSSHAGQDRTQAAFLRAEMERARLRLDNAQLRSPIDGIVITPDLQNAAGEHLSAGDTFAQVLDLTNARIDIAVDEADAPLLRAGQSVSIKLNSFPAETLHGKVSLIAPEAQPGDGRRVFCARVLLPNPNAQLRAGMGGRAKIFSGFRPLGFVLLRRPALWIWQMLWDWIGW
jgi:RND family efflux transporter MFP subunit